MPLSSLALSLALSLAPICVGQPVESGAAPDPEPGHDAARDAARATPSTWRVVVLLDSDDGSSPPLRAAIAAQSRDLEVTLEFAPSPPPGSPAPSPAGSTPRSHERPDLLLWIERTDRVSLYIAPGRPTQRDILVRDLGPAGVLSPLDVALVVRSTIEAVREGGRPGLLVPKATEPLPARDPPQVPPPPTMDPARPAVPSAPPGDANPSGPVPVAFGFEAGYALDGWSRSQPVNQGFTAGLLVSPRPWLTVFADARVMGPIRIEGLGVRVEQRRLPFDLGLLAGRSYGRSWIGGGASLGVEAIRRLVLAGDPSFAPSPTRTNVSVSAGARLSLRVRLLRDLHLQADAGADALLRRFETTVTDPETDTRTVIDRPWPVRFRLVLGFAVLL